MEKFDSISYEELCDNDALQDSLIEYGKIEEIYIERILLCKEYDTSKLIIRYYIVLSENKLKVKVTYTNVTKLIINDHWSDLPDGMVKHIYNSTFEYGKYHVFDISSSNDVSDTISFYCDKFTIDHIKALN